MHCCRLHPVRLRKAWQVGYIDTPRLASLIDRVVKSGLAFITLRTRVKSEALYTWRES